MRNRTALLLSSCLFFGFALLLGMPRAGAATTTLTPVADSYVQAGQLPNDPTFGTAPTMKVDGSPAATSYLRFNVTGLTAPPAKVTLRVFKSLSTTTAILLHPVADNTWTEAGLTFDNRPSIGATAVEPAKPWGTDTWLHYDVTALVTGDGLKSFALDTTSSTSKSLPSREATANRPELVIETAAAPTPTTTATATATATATSPAAATVVAVAGDVACSPTEANYNGGAGTAAACRMGATAQLVTQLNPYRVFALGDLQYNSGKLADFNVSYQNSWGGFKGITIPVVGNHEYGTSGAGGYFSYFGSVAAPPNGYYSFDVPVGTTSWHVAVINSECTRIGGGAGCAVGSAQHTWLQSDLAGKAARCTVVLTHKARWSSSSFHTADIQPLVEVMTANDVELLLAGHAHSYERFVPQNAAGAADPAGILQIVVGTGGVNSQGFGTALPTSVLRKNKIFGVLKLTLQPSGYAWNFVADPTTPFGDSGIGTC